MFDCPPVVFLCSMLHSEPKALIPLLTIIDCSISELVWFGLLLINEESRNILRFEIDSTVPGRMRLNRRHHFGHRGGRYGVKAATLP